MRRRAVAGSWEVVGDVGHGMNVGEGAGEGGGGWSSTRKEAISESGSV